jgi:hypothetical protein
MEKNIGLKERLAGLRKNQPDLMNFMRGGLLKLFSISILLNQLTCHKYYWKFINFNF